MTLSSVVLGVVLGITIVVIAMILARFIVPKDRPSWLSMGLRVDRLNRRVRELEREARGRQQAEVDHAAVAAAFAPPETIFHKLGLVRSNDDDVSR